MGYDEHHRRMPMDGSDRSAFVLSIGSVELSELDQLPVQMVLPSNNSIKANKPNKPNKEVRHGICRDPMRQRRRRSVVRIL